MFRPQVSFLRGFCFIYLPSYPEINELDTSSSAEQDIAWLDIPMSYFGRFVQMINST